MLFRSEKLDDCFYFTTLMINNIHDIKKQLKYLLDEGINHEDRDNFYKRSALINSNFADITNLSRFYTFEVAFEKYCLSKYASISTLMVIDDFRNKIKNEFDITRKHFDLIKMLNSVLVDHPLIRSFDYDEQDNENFTIWCEKAYDEMGKSLLTLIKYCNIISKRLDELPRKTETLYDNHELLKNQSKKIGKFMRKQKFVLKEDN